MENFRKKHVKWDNHKSAQRLVAIMAERPAYTKPVFWFLNGCLGMVFVGIANLL